MTSQTSELETVLPGNRNAASPFVMTVLPTHSDEAAGFSSLSWAATGVAIISSAANEVSWT